MTADTILTNANVYTLDVQTPTAGEIAIRDGRVVAVGDAIDPELAAGAERYDLQGHTVVPGFTDAHIHFEQYALTLDRVDVEVDSLDVALDRIRVRAQQTGAGQWIYGRGWRKGGYGLDGFPTAALLDGVAPDHPVAVKAKSGHGLWVNTRAMQIAGIDASSPDPNGGEILRDADGHPTGILLEGAMGLVLGAMPAAGVDASSNALGAAFERAWRAGLTGVHGMSNGRAFAAYQGLLDAGQLGLRVVVYLPVSTLDGMASLGLRTAFGDPMLRIGGAKAFIDGALGTRTAAMIDPYDGEPDNVGITVADSGEVRDWFERAEAARVALAIHAIGDRANRMIVDAAEAVLGPNGSPLRHRVEHAQLLHPDDFAAFAELGLVASMQPVHATSDMDMAEPYWGERCATAYAWRTMLEADVPLAFGSDAPVEPLDPLLGIHAAVTRRRRDGAPDPDGWIPQERLSVEEAVRAYTLGAAYAAHGEYEQGSISPGKFADLVVLSGDIFAIDPMDIPDVQVAGTMVAGEWKLWQLGVSHPTV